MNMDEADLMRAEDEGAEHRELDEREKWLDEVREGEGIVVEDDGILYYGMIEQAGIEGVQEWEIELLCRFEPDEEWKGGGEPPADFGWYETVEDPFDPHLSSPDHWPDLPSCPGKHVWVKTRGGRHVEALVLTWDLKREYGVVQWVMEVGNNAASFLLTVKKEDLCDPPAEDSK